MEVKFLTPDMSDAWNKFVEESPQGSIYCFDWWLDAVTNGDYKICVIVYDDGTIQSGMVLPFFSTGVIRRPRYSYYQGFLFFNPDNGQNIRLQKYLTTQKEHTNAILDYIKPYCKNFKFSSHYNYNFWSPLYWRGFEQTTAYTYLIDYTDYVPEEEFKRFSKGHKWILNKVEKKSDLRVVEGSIEDYLALTKVLCQQKKISFDESFLRRLHEVIQNHHSGIIFKIVDSAGNVHAVEYYLYDKNEAYYWSGASDIQFRDSGGHTELTWYGIRYFADKVKRFNFCGSMVDAVEKNYRNFSASPVPYSNIIKLTPIYKIGYNLREFYRKLRY